MEAEDTCVKEHVAGALRRRGLEAYAQDTGGGIVCVAVEHGGLVFWFGTAGTTWGADVTRDEESVDSVTLSVPSSERDSDVIADAIADTMKLR